MDLKHYLIVSNIALTLSFLLFRILNRDETMFRQRRLFIILSVVLSLLLPLSGLRIQLPHTESNIIIMQSPVEITNVNQVSQNQSAGWDFTNTITYIYIIISSTIVFNILFQILRVLRLYFASEKREGNIIFVKSNTIRVPFSFFRWVFIPQQMKNDDLNSIIIHENVHAKELHTLDNIIFGIACAIIWFNPFIWSMKRSLHLIHEYLADEGTIEQGMEKTHYQSLLVNQVAEEQLIVIPSSFNNNYLKKRLIMMTKNKGANHKSISGKKLIPLSVLILAVSIIQGFYPVLAQNNNKQQQTKQQDQVKESKSKEVVVIGYGTPDTTGRLKIRSVKENASDNTLVIIDDKESTRTDLEKLDPESIESISVLSGESMKAFTTKDYDGVIVVKTKDNTNNAGSNKTMSSVVVRGYAPRDSSNGAGKISVRSNGSTDFKNTLLIIDGKEASKEVFEKIDPEKISTVTVIKDKNQQKIYTKNDYDGVIVVTTKK